MSHFFYALLLLLMHYSCCTKQAKYFRKRLRYLWLQQLGSNGYKNLFSAGAVVHYVTLLIFSFNAGIFKMN